MFTKKKSWRKKNKKSIADHSPMYDRMSQEITTAKFERRIEESQVWSGIEKPKNTKDRKTWEVNKNSKLCKPKTFPCTKEDKEGGKFRFTVYGKFMKWYFVIFLLVFFFVPCPPPPVVMSSWKTTSLSPFFVFMWPHLLWNTLPLPLCLCSIFLFLFLFYPWGW